MTSGMMNAEAFVTTPVADFSLEALRALARSRAVVLLASAMLDHSLMTSDVRRNKPPHFSDKEGSQGL